MIALDQIQFDPASHRYWLAGEEMPSVTGILAAEGLSGNDWWTEESRIRGTRAHEVALLLSHQPHKGKTIEEIIEGSRWDPSKSGKGIVPYGFACAHYYLDTGIEPLLVEARVASLKFGVCGTLDMYGRLPSGRTRLTDYKTGQPQAAAEIQVSIYAMALEETYGLKADELAVTWLKPDATYKVKVFTPGGESLAIGQQAINLWRWRRAHGMV